MNRRPLPLLPVVVLLVSSLACGSQAAAPPGTPDPVAGPARPFHLGFTPFPFDISQEALDFSYARIAADADLIAIHMDNGIPWPEALAGEPFDRHIQEQWQQDRAHIPAGHAVYAAITPLDLGRDSLAPYRAASDDMPLPAPWDSARFDDPDVKTAFLNYAVRVVDYFQPDYLNVGIEVNLLMRNAPEEWSGYLELHRYVYAGLKARHPDLPVFVSLTGPDLLPGYTEADPAAQLQALQDLLPYSDYFALSLYPFMSAHLADYPAGMWDDLYALNPGKPVAVAETGFPAETVELPQSGFSIPSSVEKQRAYIADLLAQAGEHRFVFVVNFVLRDYDALEARIGRSDLTAIWRDTGLYDEAGNPRPSLELWRSALARPYQENP